MAVFQRLGSGQAMVRKPIFFGRRPRADVAQAADFTFAVVITAVHKEFDGLTWARGGSAEWLQRCMYMRVQGIRGMECWGSVREGSV